ncbi:MAG: hypothetical protein R3A80_01385 [Bdellovibrionota bacterium]
MRQVSLAIVCALGMLTSCASHKYLNDPGHGAFQRGDYEIAGDLFSQSAKKGRQNKLLYNLDAGTSYFNAGKFDLAIPHYLEAVKFWESKDYTSITEEAAKFAISENLKTYVGEDYERVLIHVFLALSYAGEEKLEDAQVEARRIDELLKQMRDKEKKQYTESAFARWLSALMWESSGEWDSARIDYESAYKIDPSFPGIRQDLLRSCVASQHDERLRYWKSKFPGEKVPKYDRKKSELVVFVTMGQGPIKVPHSGDSNALPVLYPRPWTPSHVEVKVGTQKITKTQNVLDIEDLTKKFFDEKLRWLTARKVIGLGAKAGAAYVVAKSTKSEGLGWLTFLALAAMDTTDLRGWNTLPATLRVLRVPLEPGFHDVSYVLKSQSGAIIKEQKLGQKKFLPGQKIFIVLHDG